MYCENLDSGFNVPHAGSQRRRDAKRNERKPNLTGENGENGGEGKPRIGTDDTEEKRNGYERNARIAPTEWPHYLGAAFGALDEFGGAAAPPHPGCRSKLKKVVRRAESSGTIVLFFRKLYRLLQDITGSIRLFQLGGFVGGEDKRGIMHMRVKRRVEVAKISQLSVNSRVEMRVVTRIKPLKAMQVVDFPHIEEKQRSKGATELMQTRRGAGARKGLTAEPSTSRQARGEQAPRPFDQLTTGKLGPSSGPSRQDAKKCGGHRTIPMRNRECADFGELSRAVRHGIKISWENPCEWRLLADCFFSPSKCIMRHVFESETVVG